MQAHHPLPVSEGGGGAPVGEPLYASGAIGTHTARRDTARAMSQENVEIVRAAVRGWNAGDMDALR